jgi:pyruvate dehydrogenase E2 component (dihydrolipoamide acetyltransferase)
MSVNEYKLPDVGEGLTEAEIVTWKVKVGDEIKINDIVVEIETAKSLVELPSPYAGTVQALLVPEGETVAVGTPMIKIGDGAAEPEAPADAPAGSATPDIDMSNPAATGGGENQTLVGYGPRVTEAKRRPRRGGATAATDAGAATQLQLQGAFMPGGAESTAVIELDEPAVPAVPAAHVGSTATEQVLAKPPVRKLAKDLGVDLRSLTPSGPNGTITRADVEAAQSVPSEVEAAEAPAVLRSGDRETREPIKGVRKMMGQAMVESAFTLPHVTEWITVDVTKTMKYVARLKAHRDFKDVRVSPLLVVAKAVCLAMRRTPEINAWWDEQAQEIVFKNYVNLGIAAATPRGLVVPNVKDADAMSMVQLASALNELTATAREGKTQPAEMSGGTFTITNVGVFGVDAGTPIINPGESAILCFGAVREQPWVRTKKGRAKIVPRSITTLALSFDHRFVDGQKGSQFIADVAAILEDPASAMLF